MRKFMVTLAVVAVALLGIVTPASAAPAGAAVFSAQAASGQYYYICRKGSRSIGIWASPFIITNVFRGWSCYR